MCVDSKKCSKCGRVLPLGAFGRDSSKKDGLKPACKECRNVANKRWREDNPEKSRESSRESNRRYRKKNPEKVKEGVKRYRKKNPEKIKASSRRYYQENKEEILESKKQYRKENPEKAKEPSRQWKKKNPEKVKAQVNNRRARIAGAPGHCSAEQWGARKAYYGHKCFYCGSEDDIQMDHKIPVANGGGGWASNMVPACGTCNRQKGTMPFLEFVAQKAVDQLAI